MHNGLFKELPKSISQLKNLEQINLNGNPNLDWSKTLSLLSQLPKLKILATMNNVFRILPRTITQVTSLEQVWLGQNSDMDIGDAFDKLNTLPSLQQLGLDESGLKEISFEVGQFPYVFNLSLADNQLKSIKGIEHLSNLKNVSLNNNELKEIPKNILECKGLEAISLNANPKLNLESAIFGLKTIPELRILKVNDNNITSIPNNIRLLQKLEYLFLKNNAIPNSEIERLKKSMLKGSVLIR